LKYAFDIDTPSVVGLIAGALTSTPTDNKHSNENQRLSFTTKRVEESGTGLNTDGKNKKYLAVAIDSTHSPLASIAYGIAYPFGVIGVILFVKLPPVIARALICIKLRLNTLALVTR